MKGIGVSSWTIPFEGEELFRWAKEQGLDTISPGFDYDACRTEDGMRRWCRTWSELSEKYGIALSILGVNTLCEVGMNRKEKWEESKSQNGITTIWLNNIHFKNFLKELWNTLQKTLY